MALFQGKFRIESARLKGYDYRTPGYYFVTICAKDRRHYFGEIQQGKALLSAIGQIADQNWRAISEHFPHVVVDEFVIMPNHVHGILRIMDNNVETQNFASLPSYENQFGPQSRNLSSVVRGYKMSVKKWAKTIGIDFSWQPRFHDHVIRDDRALYQIRQYIRQNPTAWQTDDYFSA